MLDFGRSVSRDDERHERVCLLGSRMQQEAAPTAPVQVSIVIPVYNEAQRIQLTLAELLDYLNTTKRTAEIVVVDDGSTDATPDLVEQMMDEAATLSLIRLPHGGKAHAVLEGLRSASGMIVGFMDADLATPLETLEPTLERLKGDTDIVIASREGDGSIRIGEPWYRHAMGRIFNWIVRTSLLPGVQDSQCGFKFMTRAARDDILPRMRLYTSDVTTSQPRVTAFDVELLYIARVLGKQVHVIPVTWRYGNHSKVNPVRDTFQNLQDVVAVWVNGKRGLYRS